MTINEKINSKIAKWLGFKTCKKHGVIYKIVENEHVRIDIHLDFLRDRNQQKWIEDELEKKGYYFGCRYDVDIKKWVTFILKRENKGRTDFKLTQIVFENQSKDFAFIQAVEQLIDKELTTK